MKAFSLLISLLLFITFKAQSQNCDSSLWKHIYKSNRLKLIKPCIIVTGTIKQKIREPDGDWHIFLKPDAGQETLLNSENKKGYLIVEVICSNAVIQPGVVKVCLLCSDCKKKVFVPKKGTHVKVTGAFVIDSKHGWNEIHPVSTIELLQ